MTKRAGDDYIIFTNGRYRACDLGFYRGLIGSRTTVAVNGGWRFFRMARLLPNLLMGDLDSLAGIPKPVRNSLPVVTFPARKDKTDLQIALEHCFKRGAGAVDIIMPDYGQPDHFIGNLMLAHLLGRLRPKDRRVDLRFVSPGYEIYALRDAAVTFRHRKGDIVSVVPLSPRVILTCRGTEYDVESAIIPIGDSRSLRNTIVGERATLNVGGLALVVHLL